MRWGLPLCLALLLSGCASQFGLADPYGNLYGNYYNHGADYRWQMLTCEQAIDDQSVPDARRKQFMRCCMGAHGVPIPDLASCPAVG
ncbi:MAG TPA: hypothetical protein VL993_08535 [Stellaceae bacterium]|nr:hypothetical protein [Stellaceae bacterium]